MNRSKKLFYLIMISFLILSFSQNSFAVPAAPTLHTLSQPDGTIFEARQWGDENISGWETEEGYTIVFDEDLNSWAYADHGPDGSLVSSRRVVGKEGAPSTLEKKLRPKDEALSRIIFKRHSRELKISQTGENISPMAELIVPPSGTANVPVILINFNDRSTTYTASNFNTLLFGTGNYSMKDYYNEVSYGDFSVSAGPGGVVGWYTASNGHNYYGANDAFGYDRWPGDLVYEAVAAADASGFNFAPYDQDGDCYVDVINLVHQGTGEEASGVATDIWSHRWSLAGAKYWGYSHYDIYTTNDACPAGGNIKVNDYVIQPEILWGSQQTMGVFAHEYGHALGLPDLYDTDYSSEGIGDWSLMAGGSWNYVTRAGDRPAHMDAWSKYRLGWVTPTQVTGTLTNEPITQAATTADVYKLLNGSPTAGEYFLIENRQKTGFDAGLPGAGLLIWHIDAAVGSNNYECYPGGPSCTVQHYKVALVQADNLWDLEKGIDRGDTGDPYPGSLNNTSFNSSSSPNSNLYNGSPSNVSVTNISAPGLTMTATLNVTVSGNPDLIVQSIATNPITPAPGQSVSVTVTIKNQGSGNAGAFDVDFYKHRTSAPPPYQVGDFACSKTSLAAGAIDTCTGTVSYASAGTYSMWAQVDTDQQVAESNEGNNVFGPQTINVILPNISVTLAPDSTSIPRGGTLGYTVTVKNNTSTSQTFKYWTYVILPSGTRYPPTGQLFGPVTVTLSPGQVRSAHLTHGIPATAPLGTYTYYGNVGPYPTVWNSDSFTFIVTSTLSPGTRKGWELLENGLTK